MSSRYAQVKKYFKSGLWTETRVRNAVTVGWITEEEFTEITGAAYQ